MFAELSELGKTQSDQVTRTVAYSTNQVLKLHQDLTNITNALVNYSADGAGPCSNSTVSVYYYYFSFLLRNFYIIGYDPYQEAPKTSRAARIFGPTSETVEIQ